MIVQHPELNDLSAVIDDLDTNITIMKISRAFNITGSYALKYATLSVKTQLKSFVCDLLFFHEKIILHMVKNIL